MILLLFVALAFIVWPLYRSSRRLTSLLGAVIVLAVGLSTGLYHYIGQPGVPSGAGSSPDGDEMVVALEKRLKETPEDVDGWLMLGRSYQSMKRFDKAISAFEKAVALEKGEDAQTLVALGIVLMESQGGEISGRAAQLFENALATEPTNPNALFYGGAAAAQRDEPALAADRWEILMGLDAPPEIQDLLQRKINEWRGLPPPAPPEEGEAAIVSINLTMSDAALSELPADATVFVIARDPAQPSPPIAVSRRRLSELPMTVTLGDSDAMVAGRPLSVFSKFEVVARVSVSGAPMAQSGDWSGSLLVDTSDRHTIDLLIDQKVP